MLLATGWAFFAVNFKLTGIFGCNTPMVPSTDRLPGVARALSFSIRNSPWLPLSSPVMSERLIP